MTLDEAIARLPRGAPPPVATGRPLAERVADIHRLAGIPAIAPATYEAMFTAIVAERESLAAGSRQTVARILTRIEEAGGGAGPDDVRFVLDAIGVPVAEETAGMLAHRFRVFVVARLKAAAFRPTFDDHALLSAWFGGV